MTNNTRPNPRQPINPEHPQLDFHPTHYECRILVDRGAYADRSDYCGSFNVHIIGTFAHVSMATGYWSKHVDRRLKRWLAEQGIHHLIYERHRTTHYKPISPATRLDHYKTVETTLRELHINSA